MKYKLFLFPLLAIVGFLAWWKLVEPQQLQWGAQSVPVAGNFLIVIYGYLVTLAGVIIGSAYRQLQQLREKGETTIKDIPTFIRSVFYSIDLWTGLLGSPIVYALLWKSIDNGSVSGLTIVALQNGFCCTVIISNFTRANQGKTQQPEDDVTVKDKEGSKGKLPENDKVK